MWQIRGGGIYISQKASNPIIVNSILWDNIPNEVEFSKDPKSKSLVVTYSNVEGGEDDVETGVTGKLYWLEGNIAADPIFVNPDDSDFRLISGSSCIDAAIENTTIIYENGRIDVPPMPFLGLAPDMGACESHDVLPVELTQFSAKLLNDYVRLEWSTVSERNNYGFEIQKSDRKKGFHKIGFLKGAGTTIETQSYEFKDSKIEIGTYSYRLKQIDLDGTTLFSSPVEIQVKPPQQFQLYPNYPNPFNSNTIIRFDIPARDHISISIYNAVGQKIKTLLDEEKAAGCYEIRWDGRDELGKSISSGVYFLTLKTTTFACANKLILLR